MRTDSEEFLTVFNEARNNKESFFTASQRLNDFSKTIRTKQNYVLGKISIEDKTPALKQLEKLYNINLSKMALRNWLFEGEIFVSPQWKQNGKPYKINRIIRTTYFNSKPQQPQKFKLWQKVLAKLFFINLNDTQTQNNNSNDTDNDTENEDNNKEDSQGDGLMTLDDGEELFPEEF
jgi:hypothetical protein